MTEEEAKTKWCPFVRLISAKRMENGDVQHNGNAPTYNRYNTDEKQIAVLPSGCFCIGSACMAWRTELVTDAITTDGSPLYTGYCGIAGNQ